MNEIRLTRAAKVLFAGADDGADGASVPAGDILTVRGMAARPSGMAIRALRSGTPHIQEGQERPAASICGPVTPVMTPRDMMPAPVA